MSQVLNVGIWHATTGLEFDSYTLCNRQTCLIFVDNDSPRQHVLKVEVEFNLLEMHLWRLEMSITVDHVTLLQSTRSGFRRMPASNARRWPEGDVAGDECGLRTLAIEDPSERWGSLLAQLIIVSCTPPASHVHDFQVHLAFDNFSLKLSIYEKWFSTFFLHFGLAAGS